MKSSQKLIQDLEDARDFFIEFGCSHFHMSREHPEKYHEFIQIGPSQALQDQWTSESLKDQLNKLHSPSTPNNELWSIHSRMEDLKNNVPNGSTCSILFEATKSIEPLLKPRDGLLVAETIIGRQHIKYKPGLIFFALKLNKTKHSIEYARIAHSLIKKRLNIMLKESDVTQS